MLSFDQYRRLIDEAILAHFNKFPESCPLKEVALYALMSGGRRIRSTIALMVAESLGSHREKALGPALAVEFFHTASLIADDLPSMDDDDFRRGKPSTHVKFGEAAAILSTYALIAEGYGLLGDLGSNEISLLLKETAMATGFCGASAGQLLDLNLPDFDFSTMEKMIQKKTGSLFELSFVSGWVTGGGEISSLATLKKAASLFGTAFQIYDDIQDQLGSGFNIAKQVGIKQAEETLKQCLIQFSTILDSLGFSKKGLKMLQEIFEDEGAISPL